MSQSGFWSRLFGWTRPAGTPSAGAGQAAVPARSALADTRPSKAPQTLRQQRHARREQLIALVRENMIRAGVLSASYKFKVLTLEPTGQQFIVMFDIQPGRSMASDPATLALLESSLQSLAKERLGLDVRHAYWRHVEAASTVEPAEAAAVSARPNTPTAPATPAPKPAPRASAMDDVSEEELKALRAALASAKAQTPAKNAARTLPDGWHERDFEPTASMEDAPQTDFSALSETQYGQLR